MNWLRVSKQRPCPICSLPGHPRIDWCLISKDGSAVICARVVSAKQVGMKGAGWLHRLTDPLPRVPDRPEKPKPSVPTDWEAVNLRCVEALPDQDDLADRLGVSSESLGRLELGWSHDYDAYTFPMRDAERRVIGLRTRFPDGTKRCALGSRTGLFIPRGQICSRQLWVCEGPSDCAALLTLGLEAIGRPSNTGGLDLLVPFIRSLSWREVVICADRDAKPEVSALTMAAANALKAGIGRSHRVKVLRTRWKDVREAVHCGITRKTLESLASDANAASDENVIAWSRNYAK